MELFYRNDFHTYPLFGAMERRWTIVCTTLNFTDTCQGCLCTCQIKYKEKDVNVQLKTRLCILHHNLWQTSTEKISYLLNYNNETQTKNQWKIIYLEQNFERTVLFPSDTKNPSKDTPSLLVPGDPLQIIPYFSRVYLTRHFNTDLDNVISHTNNTES